MPRLAVLVLVVGCGHAAPAPAPVVVTPVHQVPPDAAIDAPLDEDLDALAVRAVKLYQDWQHALDEANGDCAAATAKINALADASADVIAANARIQRAGHDKIVQLRAALEPHAAELDASAKAIVQSPTMAACAHDAAFARAIDRIGGEP
jgi:DNA-binding transcriptional regulator YbjK